MPSVLQTGLSQTVVSLTVNGRPVTVEVEGRTLLQNSCATACA